MGYTRKTTATSKAVPAPKKPIKGTAKGGWKTYDLEVLRASERVRSLRQRALEFVRLYTGASTGKTLPARKTGQRKPSRARAGARLKPNHSGETEDG